MPDDIQIRRYESMLFNYGTVQRTDYQPHEIKPPAEPIVREKPPKPRKPFSQVKDTHTLTEREHIPFDLFIKPREIVRENPRIAQKPFKKCMKVLTFYSRNEFYGFSLYENDTKVTILAFKPEDLGREEAVRTRPRRVMTPAVSLDDITNKQVRDLLVNDIYKSTLRIASEEGVALTKYRTVRAPFPGQPAPANPITLPHLNALYVSPEWRMDSVSWDNRQLRAYCDPTKTFWLARGPNKCTVCDATAARTAQQKMKERMKQRS